MNSTIVTEFFNRSLHKTEATKIKERQPFLWCSALVIKINKRFLYVDNWECCTVLEKDLDNGAYCQVLTSSYIY